MNESKIDLTNRLQREGRREEAMLWKDGQIAKFRGEGMKQIESRQAAWDALEAEYPPLPPEEMPVVEDESYKPDPASADALRNLQECTLSEVHRDVLWAYNNLEVSSVEAGESPSRGAWGLLLWGRENRDKFFLQMVNKVIQIAGKQEDVSEEDTEETEAIIDLEALIKGT